MEVFLVFIHLPVFTQCVYITWLSILLILPVFGILLCAANMMEPSTLLEEEMLLLAAVAALLRRKRRKQGNKRRRNVWVKPWLLRRTFYGQYEHLLAELNKEDVRGYRNFLRITPELFEEMVYHLAPRLQKTDTFMRKALEPGLKLAITLRYMATGDSYKSLQYGFRVAHNTISIIIPETCEAIILEFIEEYMPCPRTPEGWKEVAKGFSNRWNFHNTLGALDGKHVAIRCPPHGGSYYYNYKHFHSIVLLGLVDASYKFLFVDIGSNGNISDGGIFKDSGFYEALNASAAGIPDPEPLPHDDKPMPYVIVGDEAFGLHTWLMKPFPQRGLTREEWIFNYRLSRARRVVENSFGILVHRQVHYYLE